MSCSTTAVDALAARIHAIDWNGGAGGDRTRSRVALMREYLRRAALWTRAVQGKGWPFYDVAEFAAPGVRASEGVVGGVLESPAIVEQYPTVGKSCVWALHLATARDAGVELPELPDLFEPLIRMYERGGGFSLSGAGTIDIDGAGLYRGTLLDHLGDEPRAPETDAGLDALDGIAAPQAPVAPAEPERAAAPRYAGYTITAVPERGEGEERVLSGVGSAATAVPAPAGDPVYPSASYAVSAPEGAAAPVREAPPVPAAEAPAAVAAQRAAPGAPEVSGAPGMPTASGTPGTPAVSGTPEVSGAPGVPTMLPPAPGHPHPFPQQYPQPGAYGRPGPYPHGGYPVPPAGYPVPPAGHPGHPVPGYGPPVRPAGLRHHTEWNPDDPTVGLAEPGQRFFARFVDTVIAGVLWFLMMLATTFTAVTIGGGDIVGEAADRAFVSGAIFSFFVFPILWEWFQVSVWGRSVGKVLLGLWVIRAEGGGRLPAWRALPRALCFAPGFTNPVNWLLPWSLANVLWSLRDKERRRCLHDRIARSVVVQAR
ncbi:MULTISPECIES: RDD family protein [unclassified Nocardiopsis]|uniref:RDD family protein n=1 Tax=Nocardiopsis TaxID=2013 RepID=UPI00387B0937